MPKHSISDVVTLDDSGWLCKYHFTAEAEVSPGDESVGMAPGIRGDIEFGVNRFTDFRFVSPLHVLVGRDDKEVSRTFRGMLGQWELERIGELIVKSYMEKQLEVKAGRHGCPEAVS